MAHPPEKRQRVRSCYIHDGMGLEQAAQKFGISPRTASRWKQEAAEAGDDWDRARAASLLAGEGAEAVSREVLEEFMKLFQSTVKDMKQNKELKALDKAEALSRLSDAYVKTMRCLQKSSPELSRLAVASEVLQHLARFVRERHPQHAGALLQVLEPFGEELVKLYG